MTFVLPKSDSLAVDNCKYFVGSFEGHITLQKEVQKRESETFRPKSSRHVITTNLVQRAYTARLQIGTRALKLFVAHAVECIDTVKS